MYVKDINTYNVVYSRRADNRIYSYVEKYSVLFPTHRCRRAHTRTHIFRYEGTAARSRRAIALPFVAGSRGANANALIKRATAFFAFMARRIVNYNLPTRLYVTLTAKPRRFSEQRARPRDRRLRTRRRKMEAKRGGGGRREEERAHRRSGPGPGWERGERGGKGEGITRKRKELRLHASVSKGPRATPRSGSARQMRARAGHDAFFYLKGLQLSATHGAPRRL